MARFLRTTDAGGGNRFLRSTNEPPVGPVVAPTSGTTNGSGVLATNLTSDVSGSRVLTTFTDTATATVVGRTTTLPS